jgi:hypothetical protein
MTPTQRSLAYLRALGYHCEVVEHFVRFPPPGHRKDLWGWCDIIAIRPGEVLAVQTTSRGEVSRRVNKIAESATVAAVREAGIRIHVHGWSGKTLLEKDLS